ncbi:hypothetical protein STEG23_008469 [Scotinomys teguina]
MVGTKLAFCRKAASTLTLSPSEPFLQPTQVGPNIRVYDQSPGMLVLANQEYHSGFAPERGRPLMGVNKTGHIKLRFSGAVDCSMVILYFTANILLWQKDGPCFHIHSVNLCLFIGWEKYSSMILLNMFSVPLSWYSSPSSIPIIRRLGLFMVSQISWTFCVMTFLDLVFSLTVESISSIVSSTL